MTNIYNYNSYKSGSWGARDYQKNGLGKGRGQGAVNLQNCQFFYDKHSIQNNFLFNSVTAYSLAEVCLSPEGNFESSSREGPLVSLPIL